MNVLLKKLAYAALIGFAALVLAVPAMGAPPLGGKADGGPSTQPGSGGRIANPCAGQPDGQRIWFDYGNGSGATVTCMNGEPTGPLESPLPPPPKL